MVFYSTLSQALWRALWPRVSTVPVFNTSPMSHSSATAITAPADVLRSRLMVAVSGRTSMPKSNSPYAFPLTARQDKSHKGADNRPTRRGVPVPFQGMDTCIYSTWAQYRVDVRLLRGMYSHPFFAVSSAFDAESFTATEEGLARSISFGLPSLDTRSPYISLLFSYTHGS